MSRRAYRSKRYARHAQPRTRPAERQDLFPKPLKIGRNVWLSANVTILGGVTVGDSAVVPAGAVVPRDVHANIMAAGASARIVVTTDVWLGSDYSMI